MTQLHRIRCKTETCAWWYMGGKKHESKALAEVACDLLEFQYKGLTATVEPYQPNATEIFTELMQEPHTVPETYSSGLTLSGFARACKTMSDMAKHFRV